MMGFNRIQAKLSARESMRLNRPSPMLVTLVYYLLTSVLFTVVMYFVYDPFRDIAQYAMWGYDITEVWAFILDEHSGDLCLLFLLQLVSGVFNLFMSYGYFSYTLRMARNEQPGYSHLFDGFARPGRVLWAGILVEVFTFLWSLVVLVPMYALLAVLALLSVPIETIMVALSLAMIVVCVLIVVITYRYRLTSYFLIDDPGCTAREAVRRSVAAMKGWKGALFMLDLSFLGWILLSALVSQVVSLFLPFVLSDVLCFWVQPYRMASHANFYDCVTGASRSSGQGVGPGYDQSPEDPGPF